MVYYRQRPAEAGRHRSRPRPGTTTSPIAKAYKGKDLNGDGNADYGSCISKKRSAQSYWLIYLGRRRLLQSKGTGQGVFFDTDDMKPLINNEAFARRSRSTSRRPSTAPPGRDQPDVGDTRGLFTTGRCALSLDWGDIGTLAIDPKTSKVQDKVGAVVLPGLRAGARPRDAASWSTARRRPAPTPSTASTTRPSPPSAAGRAPSTPPTDPKVKDAAYAFLSYMSQPAAVQRRRHHRQDRLQPLPRSRSSRISTSGSRPA